MFDLFALLKYIAILFGYIFIKYAFFLTINKSYSITFFEFAFVRLYLFKQYNNAFRENRFYYLWLPDLVFILYFFAVVHFL